MDAPESDCDVGRRIVIGAPLCAVVDYAIANLLADGDRGLAVLTRTTYVSAIDVDKIRRQVHASAAFFWFVH
jgi:hypothetical protein